MKLPQIDPKATKAKSIYRELATNYEENTLNQVDSDYIQFQKTGKVLCRINKQNVYVNHSEAYYIENKRYGESIINQYNAIEIDRRRGKSKVKKIFHVKPLEELELKLYEEPVIHQLSKLFEEEIHRFRPYVYVLRMDSDTTELIKIE